MSSSETAPLKGASATQKSDEGTPKFKSYQVGWTVARPPARPLARPLARLPSSPRPGARGPPVYLLSA
jgi:hypothetical protein